MGVKSVPLRTLPVYLLSLCRCDMTQEKDDPHDDSTNWIGNLPKEASNSTECPTKRDARWPQQSDVQRKEP
jgi:hypothetical protein